MPDPPAPAPPSAPPSADPTLRRAGVDDASALSLAGAATFLETFAGILAGENILAHCAHKHSPACYAALLRDPKTAAWLAEINGAPVGYALVTTPADLPVPLHPADLELRRIYLLSRFHGTGLGARLLRQALDYAREERAPRLLLGVYQGNTRAIAFYRRMGFLDQGTRTFQVGHGVYHDLILSLPLSLPPSLPLD